MGHSIGDEHDAKICDVAQPAQRVRQRLMGCVRWDGYSENARRHRASNRKMTNIESLKPTPPKPWGIIATALWALLTVLILAVVLIVALVALALWTGGRLGQSQD